MENTIPSINMIVHETNIDNVLDREGPFCNRLQREVERLPCDLYRDSGAIGFLIDDNRKQNVQFIVRLYPGRGCIVEEVPIGTCAVIGSRSAIPSISYHLTNRFRSELEYHGEDLYKLGCGLRVETQNIMRRCGPTSFAKLGISPCICISTLAGSHFMIRGEELRGESFSPRFYHNYNFSFERNSNGQIALIDHINNRETIVNDIENISVNIEGDVFDPQSFTSGDDPSELFPDANNVYLFRQFVVRKRQMTW